MQLKHRIARVLHGFIIAAMWLAGAYIVLFIALLFL
jgi:hypothetical protein